MTLTPAQKRVLHKAIANGFVMAVNGFGETDGRSDPVADRNFDRQSHIDRLIVKGAMTWGEGSNTFVATAAGIAALQPKRSPRGA